jgi:hypothetical protein
MSRRSENCMGRWEGSGMSRLAGEMHALWDAATHGLVAMAIGIECRHGRAQ